ncbi:MAG: hypothetical protein R2764_20410 [Bacteroidales bacterium]
MKKISLLLLYLSYLSLYAQSDHLKLSFGYGFGVSGEFANIQSYYYYETPDTSYTNYGFEAISFSCSKGITFGLGYEKKFGKNIAIELGAHYSKGKSPEIEYYENYSFDYYLDGAAKFTHTYYWTSKSLQFTPEVIIRSSNPKISPYIKLGCIIGFNWLYEEYKGTLVNTIPGYYPFENWTHNLKYTMAPSVGGIAAIGSEYLLTKGLWAFMEARYNLLKCIPKKGELTEYKYRGEDQLETLPYNERFFEYEAAFNESENNNPNAASKREQQRFSLSNISLVFGFKF